MMDEKRMQYRLVNYLDGEYRNMIVSDIVSGLSAEQRYIPSKYFYDAYGSKLFEEICTLPEYYPTRTEMGILKEIATGLMAGFTNKDLVELGAGANWKIRILLDAVPERDRSTLRYLPVDISQAAVVEAAQELAEVYPELEVVGVVADFTSQISKIPNNRTKMYCFLGGTIGNMGKSEAEAFLLEVASSMKQNDSFLVGFDMVKSIDILEAAYNDSKGVTGCFNKNILDVVNHELNGDFKLGYFDHIAFYNTTSARIEMHLCVNQECSVCLEDVGLEVDFHKGETIHTENSHKFTPERIRNIAESAGLAIREWYMDLNEWFSLVFMQKKQGG